MTQKHTKVTRFDQLHQIQIDIDPTVSMQTIDGFGVNINPVGHWDGGQLVPVMETLVQDLGATLFRLDVYGQSNWVDPTSQFDRTVLNPETYRRVYTSPAFRDAWEMARWLNRQGIKPYLNASGIVPRWMCSNDGVTLADYDAFAEMMASMLLWAREQEHVQFELFGPLNETDLGPPEGPFVSAEAYVKVLEVLVQKLGHYRLTDVKLVVPEAAHYSLEYVRPILGSRQLVGRIGVVGMHTYGDISVQDVSDLLPTYDDKGTRFWMTEYGDLDETGAQEWEVAWKSTRRLLTCLHGGAQAGLVWDAYDNYHDHDQSWSLYGLLRKGIRNYTPKKRYYAAKQAYRFIRPGSVRVRVSGDIAPESPVVATMCPERGITVVGMNALNQTITLELNGLSGAFAGYVTTESLECVHLGTFLAAAGSLQVVVPANSIFTFCQATDL